MADLRTESRVMSFVLNHTSYYGLVFCRCHQIFPEPVFIIHLVKLLGSVNFTFLFDVLKASELVPDSWKLNVWL